MSDGQSVVLVTIDSFRTDYSGIPGSDGDGGTDEPTMPTLAGLADEGLVFENAIAPGAATFASATSFLTGMDPVQRPGGEGGGAEETKTRVRGHMAARQTLAERFADRGYETAAFTANPWTSRYFGFDEGFDRFEDFLEEGTSNGDLADGDGHGTVGTLAKNAANWWRGQDMFMNWEALSEDIDEWIDAAEEPYFLWVFLVDAHLPYLPPSHPVAARDLPGEPGPVPRSRSALRVPTSTDPHRGVREHASVHRRVPREARRRRSRRVAPRRPRGPRRDVRGTRDVRSRQATLRAARQRSPRRRQRPERTDRVTTFPQGTTSSPVRARSGRGRRRGAAHRAVRIHLDTHAERRRPRPRLEVHLVAEDEELFTVEDGTEEPLEEEALEAAGSALVEWWRGAQSEKERVVAAVDDLAESGRV